MSVSARDLLIERVALKGTKQAVANELDVSRTQISLYLSGTYSKNGGRVDRLEAKIIATYSDRILCPHLREDISQNKCTDSQSSPMPMSDPAALKHWIACKTCPLNPSKEERRAC